MVIITGVHSDTIVVSNSWWDSGGLVFDQRIFGIWLLGGMYFVLLNHELSYTYHEDKSIGHLDDSKTLHIWVISFK